jgi:hypothetical protein
MGEKRSAYKILLRKLLGKDLLEDPGINVGIILKRVLKK